MCTKKVTLEEWIDANGNKSTFSNRLSKPSTIKSSTADFTENYKKLYKHIDTAWGGLNVMRCAMHVLEIYFGYGQTWYHLIIRYIEQENCFEVNLSERKNDKLLYADSIYGGYDKVLDRLKHLNVIKDKSLCEWVYKNTDSEVVYIWDMYIDPKDKGTWCSAEEYNGEYDGSVFKTKEAAFREGKIHLMELEDEGELRGLPEDYDIDVIEIPKNKVSDYTLEFSGVK